LNLFFPKENGEAFVFERRGLLLFRLRKEQATLGFGGGTVVEDKDVDFGLQDAYLGHVELGVLTCVGFEFSFVALKNDFSFVEIGWNWTFGSANWCE